MAKLGMSLIKYDFIMENIDFLDFVLTEQVREKTDSNNKMIDIKELSDYLTISVDKENKKDIGEYIDQQTLKQELLSLKNNINFPIGDTDEKFVHFFNQLMGHLDFTNEEEKEKIPVLLKYIEYHESVKGKNNQK